MSVLDENLVITNADVNNADECISLAADLLLQNGYVREGYKEAVLAREAVYPTGLPGNKIAVAIPHTENTFVNKPAVAVIIPKKPIRFRAMGTEDVWVDCEIIFPLVVKDSKMQVQMLKRMMKVISDSDLLTKVRDAKTTTEIVEYLNILNDET